MSPIYQFLEQRATDVRAFIASRLRGDDEDIDKVFCWTVEKALRLSHTYHPARSSPWTWCCLIALGQIRRHFRDRRVRARLITWESWDAVCERVGGGIYD
jgi:DNA-directed RNA polymerase specialized sigma24 family protein